MHCWNLRKQNATINPGCGVHVLHCPLPALPRFGRFFFPTPRNIGISLVMLSVCGGNNKVAGRTTPTLVDAFAKCCCHYCDINFECHCWQQQPRLETVGPEKKRKKKQTNARRNSRWLRLNKLLTSGRISPEVLVHCP